MFVFLVDVDLCALGNEFVHLRLPEHVHLDGERLVELLLQLGILAFKDEIQARGHLRVVLIQIFKCRLNF